jgi:hypothetical protein
MFCIGVNIKKSPPCTPTTIVPERFWHKLNYFLFCQIFENLFITCAKKNNDQEYTSISVKNSFCFG